MHLLINIDDLKKNHYWFSQKAGVMVHVFEERCSSDKNRNLQETHFNGTGHPFSS
jgi:hypothetical protein